MVRELTVAELNERLNAERASSDELIDAIEILARELNIPMEFDTAVADSVRQITDKVRALLAAQREKGENRG